VLKVERIVERNLMVENSLLRLPTEIGCVLSGGSLVTTEQTGATQGVIVDGLVSLIQGKITGARHFLLVGHDSWQPRNRIVMHNKLWRSLAKRIQFPAGKKSEEYLIESEAGIKFFGFIECENLEPREILNVLRIEPACTLIATCENHPDDMLAPVARNGWHKSRSHHPPIEILKIACNTRTIIYAVVGFFDDREKGLAVIAQPSFIDTIFELRDRALD
jgi:hypothetical protein